MDLNNRFKAFTLAEVLITLVVIGIIASITVPLAYTNYQKHVTISKLKKAYSELCQAILYSENENGSKTCWDFSLGGEDFFKRYLSYYIKLDENTSTKLDSKIKYYTIKKKEFKRTKSNGYIWNSSHVINTNSGYTLFFETYLDDTTNQYIYIDVNGLYKGPNTFGKDLHCFILWRDEGLQPLDIANVGEPRITNRSTLVNKCKSGLGDYCTALLMKDNWQFTKDYPW